jgi:hypothetical protein
MVLISGRGVSLNSSPMLFTMMSRSGNLKPFDNSIILDGEMLVWDPVLEKYLAFGTLKTAALGKHCMFA